MVVSFSLLFYDSHEEEKMIIVVRVMMKEDERVRESERE